MLRKALGLVAMISTLTFLFSYDAITSENKKDLSIEAADIVRSIPANPKGGLQSIEFHSCYLESTGRSKSRCPDGPKGMAVVIESYLDRINLVDIERVVVIDRGQDYQFSFREKVSRSGGEKETFSSINKYCNGGESRNVTSGMDLVIEKNLLPVSADVYLGALHELIRNCNQY